MSQPSGPNETIPIRMPWFSSGPPLSPQQAAASLVKGMVPQMVPHGAPSDLHCAGVDTEMRPVRSVSLPVGACTVAPQPDTHPDPAYDALGPRW